MTDRTDRTGGPCANCTHRLWHWDVGVLECMCVCAGQQHWASSGESLGFVVQMPVILLLAGFARSSIYRVVFTPGWEDSGEDLWLPAGAAGRQPLDQHKATLWGKVIPKNLWHVERKTMALNWIKKTGELIILKHLDFWLSRNQSLNIHKGFFEG